jgi:hypothetical protein
MVSDSCDYKGSDTFPFALGLLATATVQWLAMDFKLWNPFSLYHYPIFRNMAYFKNFKCCVTFSLCAALLFFTCCPLKN